MSGTSVTRKTRGLTSIQELEEGFGPSDYPSLPKSGTSIVLGGHPCHEPAQWLSRAGLRGGGFLHLDRRAPRTVEEGRRCPSEGGSPGMLPFFHVGSALLGSCVCSLAGLVCVVLLFSAVRTGRMVEGGDCRGRLRRRLFPHVNRVLPWSFGIGSWGGGTCGAGGCRSTTYPLHRLSCVCVCGLLGWVMMFGAPSIVAQATASPWCGLLC